MQLHFDPLGGVAGDMVVAALLDLRPALEPAVVAALTSLPLLAGVTAQSRAHGDGILTGRRFHVARSSEDGDPRKQDDGHHHHDHDHGHDHDHPHDHGPGRAHHDHPHVAWREIRTALEASSLAPAVIRHAVGIFALLAEAEGKVHGVVADDVHFHEVGAWDSIADIVAAAVLVDALGVAACTVGPLPLGSGRVMTAHGPLPVPAPATAILIEGFETIDDGIAGERVTPTGAAILRHLCGNAPPAGPRRLTASGHGFGMRKLPGISNCLRVLAFEPTEAGIGAGSVAVLDFEIDDQTGEDLAEGLERLRAVAGVLDVVQAPVFGKKGRMMAHVRALARPEALDAALSAAFDETTTIGIRHRIVQRAELRRDVHSVDIAGETVRVKSVQRPSGRSAKAEADDIARAGDREARETLRRAAETEAMKP